MDKIGQRIKARREQLNISQDELASLTGYADKSAICRFESMGKSSRNIKIENLEPFAKALKTTVPYLMGLTSDPELSLEELINNDAQNILFPQLSEKTNKMLSYNGSDEPKQELAALMQDILDNVSDENQINQIKMFLETYKK